MSTNDTVLLLASGASGVAPGTDGARAPRSPGSAPTWPQQLLADAEGSTKEITIEVAHAATEDDAVEVARTVARNNLVKTAFFGPDAELGPDPGRGRHRPPAAFDPDRIDVAINGVWICRAGAATGDDRAGVDLTGRAVHVVIDLHAGGRGPRPS